MPIHINDLDVATETEGLRSTLIIPCYMCPAVTVATREKAIYSVYEQLSKITSF